MKKQLTIWQKLWSWINGRKTSIATILALLNSFFFVKHFYDQDTMVLINGILAALGLTANIANATERNK